MRTTLSALFPAVVPAVVTAVVPAVFTLLFTVALASGATAQQPQSLRPDFVRPEVHGIEDGDNSFRDRTPALKRAVVRKSYVDVDSLHNHKRQLFATAPGAVSNEAVKAATQSPGRSPAQTRARVGATGPHHGDPWPWVAGILAVMGGMLLILLRSTGRTPATKTADRFVITSRG